MEIRQAKPEDGTAVRQCAEAAYADYVASIGKRPAPMVADFGEQIDQGLVWVMGEAESVLGFVVFYPRGDHVLLENVAVHPRAQGNGLGRLMIDFVEQQALQISARAVELYTNAKMTKNLELYPSLGYREVARMHEDGFDRVYYRKTIDQA